MLRRRKSTNSTTEDDKDLPLATMSEAFSFAETTRVKLLMVAGCFCACISGLCVPGKKLKGLLHHLRLSSWLLTAFSFNISAMAWVFSDSFTDLTNAPDDPAFMDQISWLSIRFVVVGYVEHQAAESWGFHQAASGHISLTSHLSSSLSRPTTSILMFVFMTLHGTLIDTAANEMTNSFKTQWFNSLLRQDMAYFDIMDISGAATIIGVNGMKYKQGMIIHFGPVAKLFPV